MTASNGIAGFSIEEVIQQIKVNFWETWSNFGRGPGFITVTAFRLFASDSVYL